MKLSTPRVDIEEWFKREEKRFSSKDEEEFQKKIIDYFKETKRRHPEDEKMTRLIEIAKDVRIIEVGIIRRIYGFFRRLLRV